MRGVCKLLFNVLFSLSMRKTLVYLIRIIVIILFILFLIGFATITINQPDNFKKKGFYDCISIVIFSYLTYFTFFRLKAGK